MPEILFRTEANKTIGIGHLMRCVALSEAFRSQGYTPIFCTRETPSDYLGPLLQRSLVHRELDGPYLRNSPADGIIVDMQCVDDAFFQELRQHHPNTTIAAIEDFGNALKHVDFIVNPNLYADSSLYTEVDSNIEILAGAPYLLLRSEFGLKSAGPTFKDRIRRILITLGGGNPQQHTAQLVAALRPLDVELHVVVGYAVKQTNLLDEKPGDKARIIVHSNVQDMQALMRTVDLSINSAGGTLWELFCLGIPSLMYVVADDQQRDADVADRMGIGVLMGHIDSLDIRQLRSSVEELSKNIEQRRKISIQAQNVVDGLGAHRVCDAITSAIKKADNPAT